MVSFESVNGVRLRVEQQGTGPAILTLHGGPGLGDRRKDVEVYRVVAGWDYRVVSYDQRGNGESELRPPYSHEQFVEDAEALRRHLGLGRIVLAGHSYGGHLALEYALRYQEHLAGLVLSDTAASNAYHEESKQRALSSGLAGISRANLERLFGGQVRDDEEFKALYRAILPLYTVSPPSDAEVRRQIDAIPFRYETHNWAFSRNQPAFNVLDRLATITVPTLVMVGRKDWITPVAASEEIARAIAGSRLTIFEHSGHSPQLEEPERFYEAVRAFLAEVLPAGKADAASDRAAT